MDGVALGSRFSLATNRLNFCGPAEAEPLLYRAIVDGTGIDEAGRALRKFEALAPYLETIARHHGLDPLDQRVVEAYWIGNELLDPLGRSEFVELLDALARNGLPPSTAELLKAHLPPRPLLHHVFHVAFVGVGNVTGHVPTTLANMEACRPAVATVVGPETSSGRRRVRHPSLGLRDGRLALLPGVEEEVTVDPRALPGVAVGDRLAVHWRWAALALDARRAAALDRYTDRSLAQANEVLPALGTFAGAGSTPAPAS